MPDTTNADIIAAMAEMRGDICGHLHALQDDVTGLKKTYQDLSDQVGILTEAKRSSSLRAKQLGDSDLTIQAQLAEEIKAREKLAASNDVQLAILQRLDAVAKNPSVKVLLTVAATVAASWLAMKGLK